MPLGVPARRFIVSSQTVWRFHGDALRRAADEEPILLPDGERYKQLATVGRIYDALIRANADRSSAIIAIGGGVTGDVAGFAAATYLRGIPVVQVPTTLLAQVDSAVGGKVGVNHPMGKNLIGAFHPPAAVVVDPSLLSTLPRREFRAGLYEVVKYGVIASRELFDRTAARLDRALRARTRGAAADRVANRAASKPTSSNRTSGSRGSGGTLNFGHTAGHALEAVTKYRRFLHGEAVAYGMLAAAELAAARGALPEADRDALVGAHHADGAAAAGQRSLRRRHRRGDPARQEGDRRPAALRPADEDRRGDDRHRCDDGGTDARAAGDRLESSRPDYSIACSFNLASRFL